MTTEAPMTKTSTRDRETLLLTHIERWAAKELNGRYKEHVSDRLLSLWLRDLMWPIVAADNPLAQAHLKHPFERRLNLAYAAGCSVFESTLEHGCGAGGNGHHVAQSFAACIEAFDTPPC